MKQVKQVTFKVNSLVCAGCHYLTALDSIKYTPKSNHPVCANCFSAGIDDCSTCGGLEPHYGNGDCITCGVLGDVPISCISCNDAHSQIFYKFDSGCMCQRCFIFNIGSRPVMPAQGSMLALGVG